MYKNIVESGKTVEELWRHLESNEIYLVSCDQENAAKSSTQTSLFSTVFTKIGYPDTPHLFFIGNMASFLSSYRAQTFEQKLNFENDRRPNLQFIGKPKSRGYLYAEKK